MPRYKITAPDGNSYYINAPDGASEQDALSYFKSQYQNQDPRLGIKEKPLLNKAAEYVGETVLNIPGDIIETGKEVAQAALHPIDTLQGVVNLGNSAMQMTLPSEALELMYTMNPETKKNKGLINAVGADLKNRYFDNIGDTIKERPVSSYLDLLGATGLAKTIGKQVAKSGSKAIGKTISEIGTHTGPDSLNIAASAGYKGGQSGQAFSKNLRDSAGVHSDAVVNDIYKAIDQVKADDLAKYKARRAGVLAANPEIVDASNLYGDIRKSLYKGIDDAGYDTAPQAMPVRSAIAKQIDKFKRAHGNEVTPEALDGFKQSLYNAANPKVGKDRAGRAILTDAYNQVKEKITESAPEYSGMMDESQAAITALQNLQAEMSTGYGKNIDTTLRKAQGALRNNANTNYGKRVAYIDRLQNVSGLPIKEQLAGQALASFKPRGLGSLGMPGAAAYGLATQNPLALAVMAAQSPRLMGELAYAGGKAGRNIEGLLSIPESILPTDAARLAAYSIVAGKTAAPKKERKKDDKEK